MKYVPNQNNFEKFQACKAFNQLHQYLLLRRMHKTMNLQQNTIDLFRPSSKLNRSREKQRQKDSKNSTVNKASQNNNTQFATMNKHKSQPRFRTLKEEILRIPKVKQILNKDKYVFAQDIQKRIQLLGSLKAENFQPQEVANLHQMRKPKPQKSSKKKNNRHKTNFKVPLTRGNISSMNNLLKTHIDQNQKYKNQQFIFLKEYENSAPFSLAKLKFMDDLNPIKRKYKEKFPDYKEGVLSRNKLLLEHVILNRNIKRQIKLDKKKQQKIHAKRVFQNV